MGIYDREYVRVGPRSSSGLGSLRFISFNSWIIIINVVVFVLSVLSSATPVPVVIDETMSRPADPKQIVAEGVYRDITGNIILPQVRAVTRGPGGQAQERLVPNPALRTDAVVYRRLGIANSTQEVGVQRIVMMPALQAYGHFSTALGFLHLQLWRFVTFQFLHSGVAHIFFNMFGLWVFGGMVEQYLGFRRYAAFYLTCGIFGAVSYLILNLLGAGLHIRIPGVLIDSIYTPLVGASAGVFGVIIAAAYIAPNAIVQLLFPPIPLKLKWFAYGYVAVAMANLLYGGANAGGDAAHIGGAIAGFFFIRNAHLLRDFFDVLGDSRKKGSPRRVGAESSEIDRILSKVATQGLASLSDSEKRALREATERQKRV